MSTTYWVYGTVSDTYPSHLRFAYLPQNYSLYPWLSVIDNVQLAAHLRHQKTYQTTQKAEQLLNSVGLDEHIHKKVFRLSDRKSVV